MLIAYDVFGGIFEQAASRPLEAEACVTGEPFDLLARIERGGRVERVPLPAASGIGLHRSTT
jgi:hypothetical protein